jgi:hypothetical protein
LWITNNRDIVDINVHQEFVACVHSDFFQGETDRVLVYGPNHSVETRLPKQEEEEEEEEEEDG